MSSSTSIELRGLPASSDDEQYSPLLSGAMKPKDDIQRVKRPLGERVNVKQLMRVWGPRLDFVVRLMLVSTFLDDSLRTATQFSALAKEVGAVTLVLGLLAELLGSLCLLALVWPNGATSTLIGWAIAQPVLYGQLSNVELVAGSISVVGGLLMLRAHLVPEQSRYGAGAYTQLFGRLLLPAVYLYRAWLFLYSMITLDETNSFAMYLSSLSMFAVKTAMLVGLVIASMLVAAGLRSRIIALLFALLNITFVCYQHPFFRFVRHEDGEWKYEDVMWMPTVVLSTDTSVVDFEPWQIYDLHKYYFFLGLSTSGALLVLAQFGPGDISVQKNEVVLPVVARTQDLY
eukprot:CAMPEP_0194305210 /NCGR_PEP_ID=MMETSP0171-20130528/2700_1 /TAXON_ID=218684 /ORGANISM="Corethron pennatum, Strain L29A3" /LENGTH=343 /DNA_ID=CAMNT_0039056673 /DNA_START=54 /DNA_END=1085 /DNA_ORIENTATION=+